MIERTTPKFKGHDRTTVSPTTLPPLKNFILVWLDAPIELRYSRLTGRGEERDKLSFEEFKAQEDQQRKGINTHINLMEIRKLAKIRLENGLFCKFFSLNLRILYFMQNKSRS